MGPPWASYAFQVVRPLVAQVMHFRLFVLSSPYQWCCYCRHHYHQNGSVKPVITRGKGLSAIEEALGSYWPAVHNQNTGSARAASVTGSCSKVDENPKCEGADLGRF